MLTSDAVSDARDQPPSLLAMTAQLPDKTWRHRARAPPGLIPKYMRSRHRREMCFRTDSHRRLRSLPSPHRPRRPNRRRTDKDRSRKDRRSVASASLREKWKMSYTLLDDLPPQSAADSSQHHTSRSVICFWSSLQGYMYQGSVYLHISDCLWCLGDALSSGGVFRDVLSSLVDHCDTYAGVILPSNFQITFRSVLHFLSTPENAVRGSGKEIARHHGADWNCPVTPPVRTSFAGGPLRYPQEWT